MPRRKFFCLRCEKRKSAEKEKNYKQEKLFAFRANEGMSYKFHEVIIARHGNSFNENQAKLSENFFIFC